MRVLLVTPYYAPAYHFGGPVVVAEAIVSGLLAAGHEVTVATTDALDARARVPPGAAATPPGATVVRFRNRSHAIAARAMGWTPRGWLRWIGANAPGFDVLLLHDVYSVLSVGAARAARRAGVPFVLQPLGSLAPTRERGRPLVKRAFLALWGRRTLRDAAALAYCSADERDDFLAAGGPPAALAALPLPLDIPEPGPAAPADVPTLVSVGRLDPIKRIDLLLDAVAVARRSVPDLRLEIAGPGDSHAAELERHSERLGLSGAVTFHGFVSTERKLELLGSAHAFCLLSRSEGLPISALEAMACGTPVILSRGCHLQEIDGRAGVVVGETADAVADAIVALLGDEPRRRRLAAAGREFAADFRSDRALPRTTALLARVAAGLPAADAEAAG